MGKSVNISESNYAKTLEPGKIRSFIVFHLVVSFSIMISALGIFYSLISRNIHFVMASSKYFLVLTIAQLALFVLLFFVSRLVFVRTIKSTLDMKIQISADMIFETTKKAHLFRVLIMETSGIIGLAVFMATALTGEINGVIFYWLNLLPTVIFFNRVGVLPNKTYFLEAFKKYLKNA